MWTLVVLCSLVCTVTAYEENQQRRRPRVYEADQHRRAAPTLGQHRRPSYQQPSGFSGWMRQRGVTVHNAPVAGDYRASQMSSAISSYDLYTDSLAPKFKNQVACKGGVGNCVVQGNIGPYAGFAKNLEIGRNFNLGVQGGAGALATGAVSSRFHDGKYLGSAYGKVFAGAQVSAMGGWQKGNNAILVGGHAEVGAGAEGGGMLEENLRKGTLIASGGGSAFAGARAGGEVGIGNKNLGSEQLGGNVGVGVGVGANFKLGFRKCQFQEGFGTSAYLGVGGGYKESGRLNICGIAKDAVKLGVAGAREFNRLADGVPFAVGRDVGRYTSLAARGAWRDAGTAARDSLSAAKDAFHATDHFVDGAEHAVSHFIGSIF